MRVQLDDDFRPDAHRVEGCGRPPLCHCIIFNPVFMCDGCRVDLIGQKKYPTVVSKFASFSVKTYIPFLKDVCTFVLPISIYRVLVGPHDEEKCAYNQLAYGCIRTCVCPLVDVED